MYQDFREKKIKDFSRKMRRIGIDSLFLDTKQNLFAEVFAFMKRKETRSS